MSKNTKIILFWALIFPAIYTGIRLLIHNSQKTFYPVEVYFILYGAGAILGLVLIAPVVIYLGKRKKK